MKFTQTELAGVWVVDATFAEDERGGFGRLWCTTEFAEHGLSSSVRQVSASVNKRMGTLRGMHWQAQPHGETKLIRVTSGAIYDVIVDVQPMSPTFRKWIGVELTSANHRALHVPPGYAHGFITLADDTEVLYQMDVDYVADAARGFRWDDPTVGIHWPLTPVVISSRDQTLPLLG